eukprot:scaffold203453_cov18-Prasinocladus_malaysianus.AAC.1
MVLGTVTTTAAPDPLPSTSVSNSLAGTWAEPRWDLNMNPPPSVPEAAHRWRLNRLQSLAFYIMAT